MQKGADLLSTMAESGRYSQLDYYTALFFSCMIGLLMRMGMQRKAHRQNRRGRASAGRPGRAFGDFGLSEG